MFTFLLRAEDTLSRTHTHVVCDVSITWCFCVILVWCAWAFCKYRKTNGCPLQHEPDKMLTAGYVLQLVIRCVHWRDSKHVDRIWIQVIALGRIYGLIGSGDSEKRLEHAERTHKFQFNYTFHGWNLCVCVWGAFHIGFLIGRNWSKSNGLAVNVLLVLAHLLSLHRPYINWHSWAHSMTNKRAGEFFHSRCIRYSRLHSIPRSPVFEETCS